MRKTAIDPEEIARAVGCVRFAVKVAEYQRSKERYFYFEHPQSATSWNIKELWELTERDDVESIIVHMCQFSLAAEDDDGKGLVKKPTRVATNLLLLASAINRRCEGGHRHVHLMSGKAKAAVRYPPEFCKAIVEGVSVCLECASEVARHGAFCFDDGSLCEIGPDMCEEESVLPFTFDPCGYCIDDVRGGELPLELVREARRNEMQGFAARRV